MVTRHCEFPATAHHRDAVAALGDHVALVHAVAVAKGIMRSEIQRRKTINDMYEEKCADFEKAKEDIRDLKRTADKLPGYKKEFERLSKKMRTIEDYVSSYDFDTNHRVTVDADEYFNTDPDLRMFFTLE